MVIITDYFVKRLYTENIRSVSIGFLGGLVKKNPVDRQDFNGTGAVKKGLLMVNGKYLWSFYRSDLRNRMDCRQFTCPDRSVWPIMRPLE